MKKLLLILFLFVGINAYSQSYPEPIRYEKCDTASIGSTTVKLSTLLGGTLKSKVQDWFQLVIYTNDSIWVATDSNFTSKKPIRDNVSGTTFKYNIRHFSDVYFKIFGTGTALIDYWFGGN